MQIRLDVEVEINGDVLHAPSVTFLAGDRTEMLVEDEGREPFRLVVDESLLVTVDTPIYTADGTLAGQPRLSMKPGESARVEFSMDDVEYVVEIRTEAEYLPGVDAR